MTAVERKILQTFKNAFPNMTEEQKNGLLTFGECLAIKNDLEKIALLPDARVERPNVSRKE